MTTTFFKLAASLVVATAALTGSYIAVQKSLGLGWAPPVVPARLGN